MLMVAITEFLGHTLCDCPSYPQVSSTKSSAQYEATQQSWDRACLLLLACCCFLIAAKPTKPNRSALNAKGGYKTKSASTSSVTLTLTLGLTKTWFYTSL